VRAAVIGGTDGKHRRFGPVAARPTFTAMLKPSLGLLSFAGPVLCLAAPVFAQNQAVNPTF
jgi:hypothetical protein